MSLTWKDAITTLATGGVIVIGLAAIKQWNIPVISNNRWAVVIIALIGIAMCAFGANMPNETASIYTPAMGILGGAVLLFAVLGLVFGNVLFVWLSGGTVVTMWLITLVRHIIN